MSNDLTMRVRIVGQTGDYDARVTNTTAKQKQLNAELNRSPAAAAAVNRSFSGMTKQSNLAAKSIQHMSHMALSMFGVFQAGAAVSAIKNRLGDLQDMEVRLRSLSGSASSYAENEAYLAELAQKHSKDLLALSDSYSKILALEKANIVNRREGRAILEGMSNAASALGADTNQLKQSLFGMAQGFSAGTLRAEELNQVTEPLPGLLQELDKAAGLSAGGFRKMVVDGQVTSTLFKSTLIQALAAYEGAAAKTFDNVNAKQARMGNNYTDLVKAYEAPISLGLGAGFDVANSAMELFTDNANTVIDVLENGLVLAAAHGVTATTNYTAAKLRAITTDKTKRQATIASLEAEVRLLTAQRNGTLILTERIAAEKALTITRTKLAAVTTKVTVASRGMALASSVIGGLPGLLTIAGFALYSFATSADEASSKVKALTADIDALGGNYKTLSPAQIKSKILTVNDAIKAQSAEVLRLSKVIHDEKNSPTGYYDAELKRWIELGEINQKSRDLIVHATADKEKAVQKLNKEMALHLKLQDQLLFLDGGGKPDSDKVNPVATTNGDDVKRTKQLEKSAQQYLKTLSQQVKLFDDKSEAARLAFEIEHGNLQGITPALRAKLELQATELDTLKEKQRITQELEQLEQAIRTPTDAQGKENQTHNNRVGILNNTLALTPESEVEQRQHIHTLLETEHQRHQDALVKIKAQERSMLLGNGAQLFDGLAGLALAFKGKQSGIFKAMFAASKAFAVAQSIVNIQAGISQAASLPFPANLGAMAVVASETVGIVSTIKGTQLPQAHNGLRRAAAEDEGTWRLRRDEMVLNPVQRDNFEYLVNYAKNGNSGSGSGTIVYLTNHIKIEGDNNTSESLESAIELSTEKMRADLYEDFSTGGLLTQQLKAAM
jgi:tape measure domain-containing protein